ncbi:hypothetical protein EVAR_3453_1 [Eumeta japonica]|uniref:Uncharacterized protein n=1 Tax=Eumeta variegata TaxID=151549 RepID=A0A4C1SUW7_EUMVA|nr:hypothetical protein EVAR_3453_1 [Eumeta japonica]
MLQLRLATEDEINKMERLSKKRHRKERHRTNSKLNIIVSSHPSSFNDVPSLPHLSNRIEASPSAGSVLHLVSFGKILQSANVKDILNSSVKRIGRNCIALSFPDSTAANTFLYNPLLALKGLRAFILSFNVTCLGLMQGVLSDWSPEKIVGCIVVPEGSVRC